MKAKLERYLRWLREGFLQMLRLHPVESALTVYACAGCLLTYELDWDHSLPKLALAALFSPSRWSSITLRAAARGGASTG